MVLMRVIVLGAGAVGLTTAIRLLEAGCDVRVVTAAPIEATTSYLTAGIWFPTHVGPPGLVAGWGRRTFEVLAEMVKERTDLSDEELRQFFAMGMLLNVLSAIDLLSVPDPWAQNLCPEPEKIQAIRAVSEALKAHNQGDEAVNTEVPA